MTDRAETKQCSNRTALCAVMVMLAGVGCSRGLGETGPAGAQGEPGGQGPQGVAGPAGPSGAADLGLSVLAYGADPTGANDNTNAFTLALNSAASAGAGTVFVPPGRYLFKGTLTIPANVVLAGTVSGPFDPAGDPSVTTLAPTLLITSEVGPFITSAGANGGIENLLFFYPNLSTTDATPKVFPTTVLAGTAGFRISGCTFVNSYVAITIEVGRVWLDRPNIGAYSTCILIDNALDFVQVSHVLCHAYWDIYQGAAVGAGNFDAWIAANSYALIVHRCDSLLIDGLGIFYRYAGIQLSASAAGAPYGKAVNVDIDHVLYGVIARATNPIVGFHFANLDIGAMSTATAQSAMLLQADASTGTVLPFISWSGGSTRGWSNGTASSVQVGALGCSNLFVQGTGFLANSCP